MPNNVDATLLNPNQLRYFGTTVQYNPFDIFSWDPEGFVYGMSGTDVISDANTGRVNIRPDFWCDKMQRSLEKNRISIQFLL